MSNDLRYMYLVETRRLLLLMGVVFGMILFVQYFELPYSNILSSLFATGKSQISPAYNFPPSRDSSISPSTSKNLTYLTSSNSTDLNAANEVLSTANSSDGNDRDAINVEVDFDTENSKSLNDTTLSDDIDPEDESRSMGVLELDHNAITNTGVRNNSFPLEKSSESHDELPESESTSKTSPLPPNLPSNFVYPKSPETSSGIYIKTPFPITSMENDSEKKVRSNENQNENSVVVSDPPISTIPARKERSKETEPAVVPISKMNDMLLKSYILYGAVKKRRSSAVDQELSDAKALIENASIMEKDTQFDVNLYRNFSEFKRSYELMEQTLKVYIYAEGERPIFHQPPLKGIYASEGWFMKLLKANKKFVTRNPKKAHFFYLPFSSRMLEETLYVPNSHSRKNLIQHLSNYVDLIRSKYNFWNRTDGADHFLVACHDWAPVEMRQIMANCIRALCNSDLKEGFQFGKDVSLPETFIRSPQKPLRELGGKPPSQRRILAFFAGNMHGYLRPILLSYWENKDPDMKIFGRMRKVKRQMSYVQYMKSSKYCICAKGYEVNSPRVVEAIFYECVPVIISDNFVLPFFGTLNWESFAVFVMEKDIPNLKNILLSISKRRYLEMQGRVRQVQRHFLWHSKPVKYDVFHMILHSIWYNRVLQMGSW